MKIKKIHKKNDLGMSIKEVAESLGIGMNKAYELVNKEDFPKVRIGNRYIILRNKLEEWLDNNIGQIL
jgi:excisionase family DNA binding protein